MVQKLIDTEALIAMFQSASARQGAQLQKATHDATLAALQGRELTLKNIRGALNQVAGAASEGVAKNLVVGVDPEALLDKAVTGIDQALLKAVQANQTALNTLMAQGADLRDKHLKKAVDDLDKMEDNLFAAMKKTAGAAGAPLAAAWGPVLERLQAGGSLSGTQAASAAEDMAQQMQTALRSSRAASIKAAQALAESYTAMVSGVLIGMSQALETSAPAKKAPRK